MELSHLVETGRTFHRYINPERPMRADAEAVHGLSDAFLADKPVFAEIADALLTFLGDAPLVIHNASFDMRFLNAEFSRLGLAPLPMDRAEDTLALARRRFPGAQASLDALCMRFGVDTSDRSQHGALLDSRLLAQVYLELRGGRQPGLTLLAGEETATTENGPVSRPTTFHPPRPHAPSAAELAAHEAFIAGIPNALWRREG